MPADLSAGRSHRALSMAGQSRLFCQSPSTCARYTHQAMYYPNQPNHTDRWLYQGVANPNPTHLPHRTTLTKADGEERTHKLPTHTKHGRAAQRGSRTWSGPCSRALTWPGLYINLCTVLSHDLAGWPGLNPGSQNTQALSAKAVASTQTQQPLWLNLGNT